MKDIIKSVMKKIHNLMFYLLQSITYLGTFYLILLHVQAINQRNNVGLNIVSIVIIIILCGFLSAFIEGNFKKKDEDRIH